MKTEGERVGKKDFGAVLEWDITREWLWTETSLDFSPQLSYNGNYIEMIKSVMGLE